MIASGLSGGDRGLYLGIGQLRGRHCDVLFCWGGVTRFASVRFETGAAVLARAEDIHPIPRRPPPDF